MCFSCDLLIELTCFHSIEWIAVSKHSTQPPYGKLNEEQLRILDDVPGSAVELQAKDKVCFLLVHNVLLRTLFFTKNLLFSCSFCGN